MQQTKADSQTAGVGNDTSAPLDASTPSPSLSSVGPPSPFPAISSSAAAAFNIESMIGSHRETPPVVPNAVSNNQVRSGPFSPQLRAHSQLIPLSPSMMLDQLSSPPRRVREIIEPSSAVMPREARGSKRSFTRFAEAHGIGLTDGESSSKRMALDPSAADSTALPQPLELASAASDEMARHNAGASGMDTTNPGSPISASPISFVRVLQPDPRAFEDSHSFTLKSHRRPVIGADGRTHALGPPKQHISILSPQLTAAPPPAATNALSRSRLQLRCPPTPAPKMSISLSAADLHSNKILLPLPKTSPVEHLSLDGSSVATSIDESSDEDVDIEEEQEDDIIDIHALSSFLPPNTQSANQPFGHTTASNNNAPASGQHTSTGPYLFQLDFTDHKLVGVGSFHEVFRCESKLAPTSCEPKVQQLEFQQFSKELERKRQISNVSAKTSAGDKAKSSLTASRRRKRVYAIKKSLRCFTSEFDRECYLRESRILDFLNREKLTSPLRRSNPSLTAAASVASTSTSSSSSTSLTAPTTVLTKSHRNPHIVRSFLCWQENGFFFERLEYCLCTLNEFVFILQETEVMDWPLHGEPIPKKSPSNQGINQTTPTENTNTNTNPPSVLSSMPTNTNSTVSLSIMTSSTPSPPAIRPSPISLTITTPALSPTPCEADGSFSHKHLLRLFLSILTQITLSLYSLHKNGVVHLDVKPDNILLSRRRSPRLLLSDFGFAKHLQEIGGVLDANEDVSIKAQAIAKWATRADNDEGVEGDSRYLAPELLASNVSMDESTEEDQERQTNISHSAPHPITTKVDQFSLGLLLFELLSNCELPKSGYLWQRLRSGHVCEFLPAVNDLDDSDATNSASMGESEDQEIFGMSWMSSVIINLLEPAPDKRRNSSEMLLEIYRKLVQLQWIEPSVSVDSLESSQQKVEQLAFEWTATLPTVLVLPPLQMLNYAALIQHAREQNQACPTPTPLPTPRASPCPLWPGSLRSAASPSLRRQFSSPSFSPSPTANYRAAATKFTAHEPPSPLPHALPQFHAARPASRRNGVPAAAAANGAPASSSTAPPTRPSHLRSSSLGLHMPLINVGASPSLPPAGAELTSPTNRLSGAPPTHSLTLNSSGSSPSLRRTRPKAGHPALLLSGASPTASLSHAAQAHARAKSTLSSTRSISAKNLLNLTLSPPSAPAESYPFNLSLQPLSARDSAPADSPSSSPHRISLTSSSVPPSIPIPGPLVVPSLNFATRGPALPLSPFKLNSPARKKSWSGTSSSLTTSSTHAGATPPHAPQAVTLMTRGTSSGSESSNFSGTLPSPLNDITGVRSFEFGMSSTAAGASHSNSPPVAPMSASPSAAPTNASLALNATPLHRALFSSSPLSSTSSASPLGPTANSSPEPLSVAFNGKSNPNTILHSTSIFERGIPANSPNLPPFSPSRSGILHASKGSFTALSLFGNASNAATSMLPSVSLSAAITSRSSPLVGPVHSSSSNPPENKLSLLNLLSSNSQPS